MAGAPIVLVPGFWLGAVLVAHSFKSVEKTAVSLGFRRPDALPISPTCWRKF